MMTQPTQPASIPGLTVDDLFHLTLFACLHPHTISPLCLAHLPGPSRPPSFPTNSEQDLINDDKSQNNDAQLEDEDELPSSAD